MPLGSKPSKCYPATGDTIGELTCFTCLHQLPYIDFGNATHDSDYLVIDVNLSADSL